MVLGALSKCHQSLYLEGIIQDEEEFTTPLPIFISYQWSLQEEVKLLKSHLEMAGYEGFVLLLHCYILYSLLFSALFYVS